MSNIAVVHSTPKLTGQTNFTNNFLNSLLENYCNSRYSPNTVVQEKPENITLDSLILHSYPNYVKRECGVYGHVASTEVKVMYEAGMEPILQSALEHKLEVLFVRVKNLRIKNFILGRSYSNTSLFSFYSTAIGVINRRASAAGISNYFNNFYSDFKYSKLPVFSFNDLEENLIIYKPNVDSLSKYSQNIIEQNEMIFSEAFSNIASERDKYIFLSKFLSSSVSDLSYSFSNDFINSNQSLLKTIETCFFKRLDVHLAQLKDKQKQQEKIQAKMEEERKKQEQEELEAYMRQHDEFIHRADLNFSKTTAKDNASKFSQVDAEDVVFSEIVVRSIPVAETKGKVVLPNTPKDSGFIVIISLSLMIILFILSLIF